MIIHDANGQPYDADLVPGPQYRELVAALREIAEETADDQHETWEDVAVRLVQKADRTIRSRAESAAPAKHPDTVRLDWLEAFYKATEVGHWKWHELEDRMVADGFRSAIDAARKQGGEK